MAPWWEQRGFTLRTSPHSQTAAIERAARATRTLASGLIAHPANDALRADLASGLLSEQTLVSHLVRLVIRLSVLGLLESRGLIETPCILSRARSRETRASRDAWRLLHECAPPIACLSPLWDDDHHPRAPGVDASIDDDTVLAAVREIDVEVLSADEIGQLYESLLALDAEVDLDERRVSIHDSGVQRRARGAFYTPEPLVAHLLDTALEPVIERRLHAATNHAARERTLLETRVCDPSCGSGRFLMSAAARLADHLARVRARPGTQEPTERTRSAMADVLKRCIFGVDIDPVAVGLCRLALWLEAPERHVGAALERHIKIGNALLGATPVNIRYGIPDDALRDIEGDDPARMSALRRRNRRERQQRRGDTSPTDPMHERLIADAWCAAFFYRDERDVISDGTLQTIQAKGSSIPATLHDAIIRATREQRFFHWHLEFPEVVAEKDGGFDVVIGNPPFLNQLESATASSRAASHFVSTQSDGAVRGYTDTAAAFLLRSVGLLRTHGRVALVMPRSILVSKDAGAVRRSLLEHASLAAIWVANEHVFDGASVYTCAPTLERNGPRMRQVVRQASAAFTRLPPIEVDTERLRDEETWASLVAAASEIPEFACVSPRVLGDIATATADFRDQFYGLKGFLIEHDELVLMQVKQSKAFPPIVTSGLIDLAECRWGRAATRILKRSWRAPRIDRGRMERDGELGPWITQRLVPKVLLATQTRVLEVFVDERGEYVPSIPLITIVPRDGHDLWRIGACVGSPVASAIAMRHYAGAALSIDAIKLSAKQTMRLPIPTDDRSWNEAASMLRALHASDDSVDRQRGLREFARTSTHAFGLAQSDARSVIEWWSARMRLS